MGTRDFGMGYAQGRRRRPLFRVWGYAPTREAVSVIFTLSFTRMCKVARAKGPGREWRDSRLRLPLTFTERATRSTWWRISRPITSRSSRCCRTGIKALVLSGRVMLPGRGIPPDRHISRSLHTIYGRRPSGCMDRDPYGGMLWRAATRPSTLSTVDSVSGGMKNNV